MALLKKKKGGNLMLEVWFVYAQHIYMSKATHKRSLKWMHRENGRTQQEDNYDNMYAKRDGQL